APGRGHGRGHPRGCAAAHLRPLPPGAPRPRRHGPGPGDRARHRGRPRRSRDRRVAGREGEPLYRAPAALLRTIAVATLVILLAGGCVSLPPWPLWRSAELAEADRLAQQGDYAAAVAAYDTYLAKGGDGAEAGRARCRRGAAVRPGAHRPAHGADGWRSAHGGAPRAPAPAAGAHHDRPRHDRHGRAGGLARRLRLPDEAFRVRRAPREDPARARHAP